MNKTILAIFLASMSLVYANETEIPAPPEVYAFDDASVDLISGHPTFSSTDLSIGKDWNSLTFGFSNSFGAFYHFYECNYDFYVVRSLAGPFYKSVSTGCDSQLFKPSGIDGQYTSVDGSGATLIETDLNLGYEYTSKQGVVYRRDRYGNSTINYPNGYVVSRTTKTEFYPHPYPDVVENPIASSTRTSLISSNTGLRLNYVYTRQDVGNHTDQEIRDFRFPKQIIASNSAFEFCSIEGQPCDFIKQWPNVSYKWPLSSDLSSDEVGYVFDFVVTNSSNQKITYKHEIIRDPKQSSLVFPRVVEVHNAAKLYSAKFVWGRYLPCTSCIERWGIVTHATVNGVNYEYRYPQLPDGYYAGAHSYSDKGTYSYRMRGNSNIYIAKNGPTVKAEFNEHESNFINKLTTNGLTYSYGRAIRGNITKRTTKAENGTAILATIEAGYPDSCENLKTCNKPLWTKDANGNVTDYEYHQESGQILKITKPADENGIRPVTHYQYEQKYARYYKNNATTIEQADSPIWLLTSEITCIAKAATETGCQAGDALTTTYEYGKDTEANNLWLTGTVVTSASGESRRTCYEYDMYGNQIGESSPSANLTECP